MSLPPHDPYAQPSPVPQSEWGQPTPAPQGEWGQPSPAPQGDPGMPGPQGAWGDPAPAAERTPAPGTDLGADLGAALAFAGSALLRNPATYLVSGLIFCLIYIVIVGGGAAGGFLAMFSVMDGPNVSDADAFTGVMAFYGILFGATLLVMPFSLLWQSGAARAAEIVREGGRPTLGQAMIGPMRVVLTALLYLVIVFIGILLLYIPGLIAAVLFMFSIPAAIRGASPMEAMKESFALVKANLGTAIVSYLVIMIVTSLASTIVVGLLVLTPFMMLFELGLYERLNGRRLPEPAKA